MFDYFYGQQADQFSFYRVPKVLFTEDCFWNVSTDAKLLYGILLDRMNLSARNDWLDKAGRVYIIFTIDEIKSSLGCAEKKAVKLLDELEKKCGLIERTVQQLWHSFLYGIQIKQMFLIVLYFQRSLVCTAGNNFQSVLFQKHFLLITIFETSGSIQLTIGG